MPKATSGIKREPSSKGVSKRKTKKARKEFKPRQLMNLAAQPQIAEQKAVDTNFNLTFGNEDSLSSKIILCNNMNQGAEAYERQGRMIRVRNISIRGVVYPDGALPPNDVLVMCLTYSPRTSPGLFTNIFNGVDYLGVPTGTSSYRPFNMRNLENTDIWKVLWRKEIRITDLNETSNNTETNNMLYEAHIPMDVITKFDNTPVGSYSGSVVSGALTFFVQGLTQPLSTATLLTQGTIRCTYEDC